MNRDSFSEHDHVKTENVASSTECTGLIAALPMNDPEAVDDLSRLYAVHEPKKRDGKRCEGTKEERRSQASQSQR